MSSREREGQRYGGGNCGVIKVFILGGAFLQIHDLLRRVRSV